MTSTLNTTDKTYMQFAETVKSYSPNLGRKTSCVFVCDGQLVFAAPNTFPDGVRHLDERLERPACYRFIEHAERNVIAYCARRGIATVGCTAYLPWFPCVDCARMLVGVGIARMVCVEPDWDEEQYFFKDALAILQEGGVEVDFYRKDA